MSTFATTNDLIDLWRPLTTEEEDRAENLLIIVSDELRLRAKDVGKDLDEMIEATPALASVAKSVTCDVVARCLMTSTNQEPTTQFSQSALGYSVSGTYLVPGGGLFIKKNELARLGLRKQKLGGISLYGSEGNNDSASGED
jgi:hypothetical protein